MPTEPELKDGGGEGCRALLRALDERNTLEGSLQLRPRVAPYADAAQRVVAWITASGSLLLAVAVGAALLGWDRSQARYAASIAMLVMTVAGILTIPLLLLIIVSVVRRTHFWRREFVFLDADSALVERLAVHSGAELKTIHQLLLHRRDAFMRRLPDVLGPAAKVSPIFVLFLALLIAHGELTGLVEQTAPWAMQTGPGGWISAFALVAYVVCVRFRSIEIDQTYSTCIALVESAHDRAAQAQAGRRTSTDEWSSS
jgi:hypothetical protein